MLRQALVITLFATSTLTASAIQAAETTPVELQQVLVCWDQTFAYNGFRIESSEQRFYISLQGSQLVKEGNFSANNGVEHLSLNSDDWGDLNIDYHVAFSRADCTLGANNESLTCAKGDLMVNEYNESFYRTRKIDDLGTIRDVTSRFHAQRLELSASSEGFTLKKIHRYPGTGEIVTQTISVQRYEIGNEPLPLGCNDAGGEQFIPHAAPALVDHLETR